MKKIGTLYYKQDKQNYKLGVQIPTRRKQSFDSKSNYTRASQKQSVQQKIKSVYLQSHTFSQAYHSSQFEDTMKQQYTPSKSNSSVEQSFFDSLDIYNQKQIQPEKTTIVHKLTSLKHIFSQLKQLKSIEHNKMLLKDLSRAENELLSLQRQLIQQ